MIPNGPRPRKFNPFLATVQHVEKQAAALNLEDSMKRLRTDMDHMSTATWQIWRCQHHPENHRKPQTPEHSWSRLHEVITWNGMTEFDRRHACYCPLPEELLSLPHWSPVLTGTKGGGGDVHASGRRDKTPRNCAGNADSKDDVTMIAVAQDVITSINIVIFYLF